MKCNVCERPVYVCLTESFFREYEVDETGLLSDDTDFEKPYREDSQLDDYQAFCGCVACPYRVERTDDGFQLVLK